MRTVTVLDVTTEAIIYKSLTLSNYQQYSEAKRTSENKGLEEMQASTREGNVGQSISIPMLAYYTSSVLTHLLMRGFPVVFTIKQSTCVSPNCL